MDFAAKGLFFKENDAFQVILHHHVLVSQKYEKNLSFFVILNLHKNTNLNFKITSSSLFFAASTRLLQAKNFLRRTVIEVTLITFVKLFCFSLASLMKLS